MNDEVNPGDSLLLRNARIVSIDRVIDNAGLLIEEGRITHISDSNSLTTADRNSVLDLSGLTLWPGFIDVHIHGAAGIDTMQARAEDLAHVSEFLARQGVTGWLPTVVPSARAQYETAISAITEAMREQQAEKKQPGRLRSQVLGVHYEGPFVSADQCGALHREHFRSFNNLTDLDTLPSVDFQGAIHMMTLAPEIEGGIELIRQLNTHGWVISIGHTRADIDMLDQALAAGAHHMTHFMNAMTPLHHRAPGPIGWGLTEDEVTCDLIADGVHLDPMILRLVVRCKTPERLSLISDAIAAAGLGNGEYQIWGETISVTSGRTRNSHGSIAGSVITMLDAVRLMRRLGLPEPDVARMASLNPARLLGIDDECGSIAEGKWADLVALDHDGNVRLVMVRGRIAVSNCEAA